jgi:hypothetical protein
MLALIVMTAWLLEWKFPFRREAVIRSLEQTGSRVEIGSFETKWFPPRFTARGVKISRSDGVVLSIGSAAVSATYTGLLRNPRRFNDLEARDVNLAMPAKRLKEMSAGNPAGFAISHVHITSAAIDFTSDEPARPPFQLVIHSLTIEDLAADSRSRFNIALHISKPSGDVRSEGSFGPFNRTDPLGTPVSGSFTFARADISIRKAIAGMLSASGEYRGPLRAISCKGTADAPFFQVVGSSNAVHLSSRFDVTVNARNGDVALNQVISHFNGTTISAAGTISHQSYAPGKVATIDVDVSNGRVEDLLLLFTRNKTAAMKGLIAMRARFTIPPGPEAFLRRLGIRGKFSIRDAYFSNATTQAAIDRLSSSARGEPKPAKSEEPALTTAEVDGEASDPGGGIVHLTGIEFHLPGTSGQMDGTFGLQRKTLRFEGNFETQGKLAATTYGSKSAILKLITPLWHKRQGRRSVPFDITGTAARPHFRLRL